MLTCFNYNFIIIYDIYIYILFICFYSIYFILILFFYLHFFGTNGLWFNSWNVFAFTGSGGVNIHMTQIDITHRVKCLVNGWPLPPFHVLRDHPPTRNLVNTVIIQGLRSQSDSFLTCITCLWAWPAWLFCASVSNCKNGSSIYLLEASYQYNFANLLHCMKLIR